MVHKLSAVLLLSVCGIALAFPSDPYGPPPHKGGYKEPPKPYSFEYGVNDAYAGNNFGQKETSDGKNVHGSYTVQLPDGRKQTVTYTADHHNGYVAEVKYYGEAKYPVKGAPPFIVAPDKSYQPEPQYKPEPHVPIYRPQPAYH